MSGVVRGEAPSGAECGAAVSRVREARLAAYRSTQDLLHMTDAALQERLTGLPLAGAERAADGWWRVGTIVDELADRDYDVWYRPPEPARLAVSERPRPAFREPGPPTFVPEGQEAIYRGRRFGGASS